MAGGVERQIFEGGGSPEEPDDFPVSDTSADQAVSDAIRELGRGSDAAPPPRQPAQRAPEPAQPGSEGVEDKSQSGLLKALLDERERRQDTARQLERYQTQEREAQARQQKPALSERLFTDPDAALADLRTEWTAPLEQRIAQLQLNQDFGMASVRHGEKFGEAWNAWYDKVKDGQDANSYFAVMNAASPGEALVQWHADQAWTQERQPGETPAAFRQRVIDEYLANGSGAPPAQQQPQARERGPDGKFVAQPPAQRLPTQTSRLGASSKASHDDDDDNDGSDAAIFAAARPTRRRDR